MNPEQLWSHEVAEQLKKAGYPVIRDRVVSLRLAALLDLGQSVRLLLATGRFEQNEFGYATITVEDRRGSGERVDALRAVHHDPLGNIVELGEIARIGENLEYGTATIPGSNGYHEPLLPTDERWDAIVGTIGRAVGICFTRLEEQS